ncbi:MAG TPA: HAD-IA family hydrolase [Caulobacteraceae bacterium]
MALKAVLFDLGGVLLPFDRERRVTAIAARTGASQHAVRTFMASDIHQALDRGDANETDLAAAMGVAFGRPFAAEEAIELVCSVFEAPNHDLWALAAALRGRVTVGGFSDNPVFVTRMFPHGAKLEPMLFSSEVRACKPSAAAFAAAEAAVLCAPEEILFIDDSPPNIAAAKARGWDGIVFVTNAQIGAELAQRGLA